MWLYKRSKTVFQNHKKKIERASKDKIIIKLELELNEVNAVMVALGQMPYAQVEQLVTKIRQQAIPQAQEAPKDALAVTK